MRNAPARAQPASDPPNDAEQPTPATRILLTPEQQRAVEHGSGNLQLIACAGSGKTEVVAQRVAYLLDPCTEPTMKHENIIAFTFTNKAAAELKHRITARVKERLGTTTGMAELYVGTIHAFCLNLIHQHERTLRSYAPLPDIQQQLLINSEPRHSGLDRTTTVQGDRIWPYVHTPAFAQALSILREDTLIPDRLRDCTIYEAMPHYQNLLRAHRFLDHSAKLDEAVRLLRDDGEVRRHISNRIRYVVVDEYQDINPVQEQLLRSLQDLGAYLCVVGDVDQTIYQWRGSDVNQSEGFKTRYPNVTQIFLRDNFRSSDGIIETANAFISQNPDRERQHMHSHANSGISEHGDIGARQHQSAESEAQWITAQCQRLHGIKIGDNSPLRGLTWSDMAVLVRRNRDAAPIVAALRINDVPVVLGGSPGLFKRPETTALRTTFHFLAECDVTRRTTVHRCPTEDDVHEAWSRVALQPDRTSFPRALTHLLDEKRSARGSASRPSLQRVLLELMRISGIREPRRSNPDEELVMANLGKFSELIAHYDSIHHFSSVPYLYESFAKFLYFQAPTARLQNDSADSTDPQDAVAVMTVHQAKGLEWPVVFIPCVDKGAFPLEPKTSKWRYDAWNLIPADAIPNSGRYQTTVQDERRLLYVAMTRSKKFLHLTSGSGTPSRFWHTIADLEHVSNEQPNYDDRERADPRPTSEGQHIRISFSDLKLYLSCPYEYKLRVVYGFESPNHIALGYGAGLHNALAEVHNRVRKGEAIADLDLEELLDNHMRIPFARDTAYEDLVRAAGRAIDTYLEQRGEQIPSIEFVEKDVEVHIGPDVTVTGRIDFVRRADSDEVTITDLKSTKRSQSEDISELQLNLYALGYEELTGSRPDHIEIFNLDSGESKSTRVTEQGMERNRAKAEAAAQGIRERRFDPDPAPEKCAKCDFKGICAAGQAALTPGTPSPGSASPVFSSTLATATKSITTAAPRRDSRRATPRTRGRGHPADR